jgi:hypothetical protein
MQTQDLGIADGATAHAHAQKITIHVNERPVVMVGHQQTGLEIKKAAIAQNIPIKLDFVLSIERGHGHDQTKIIGDDDSVRITGHSRFAAVDDDDNS